MGTRADLVWAKVDRRGPDECWPWTGAVFAATGYGQVSWQRRPQSAARVVLELTLGRPLVAGREACHTCDNRLCCNPAHLYEGTRKENVADARARGRLSVGGAHAATVKDRALGERNGQAKLTAAQVRCIRRRRAAGETHQAIADRFGVSRRNVSKVLGGQTWSHVREED